MHNDEGISPVIGAVLMVAITVILAATTAYFIFAKPTEDIVYQKDITVTTRIYDGGDMLVDTSDGELFFALNYDIYKQLTIGNHRVSYKLRTFGRYPVIVHVESMK